MNEEYPYREPYPRGGTSSEPFEDEKKAESKPDPRTRKELADHNSMKFGRRMGVTK